jgi:hypothetical protein
MSQLNLTKQKWRFAGLLAAIGIALTGCVAEEPTASPSPTQSATPSETPSPTPEPVFISSPLTGVIYPEGANSSLTGPAISAKIDNVNGAFPQWAINQADIVFVTQVELGLTRLVSVWHSYMPESIGPVRSVRPTDPGVFSSFGGIFVFSGGQQVFIDAATATGLYMADENTELGKDTYYREPSRNAPHNLLFRAAALQQQHLDLAPPQAHFTFADGTTTQAPTAVSAGVAAMSAVVKYRAATSIWNVGEAEFSFDAAGNAAIGAVQPSVQPAWLRAQDGKLQYDQVDGSQLRARNLVIIEHTTDESFRDKRYGVIPRAILVGEGIAHVLTDGHYLKARWSKASETSPFVLTTEAGDPVLLAVGNTWIELIDPADVTLEITYPAQ